MKVTGKLIGLAFVILAAAWVGQAAPAEAALDALSTEHPGVQAVMNLQAAETPVLMKIGGILGTAVGIEDNGQPSLVVYVDRDFPNRGLLLRHMPAQVQGISLRVELTDKFRAFGGNTGKQAPPIQLGTSGGWVDDLANGYCCGGTLGSLLQANGIQYLLSNYHVLEADITPGGNGLVAKTGDAVIQPGLIDAGCYAPNAQKVASLVKLSSLPGANVDAAVAMVLPGMVDSSGAILGIGVISTNTVSAKLRQGVKKSGRTSGLTASKISGLNATISVAYESECAGGTAFVKTFTGQIVIANNNSSFLRSGDSGSLLVENVATKPRAVGLLYAGSSTSAIANPIGQVLQFLSSKLGGTATLVGK